MFENLIKGQKLRVKLDDDVLYEGVVHHVNENMGRLEMIKVIDLKTGTRYDYLQHFMKNEIVEIQTLGDEKRKTVKKSVENPVVKLSDSDNSEALKSWKIDVQFKSNTVDERLTFTNLSAQQVDHLQGIPTKYLKSKNDKAVNAVKSLKTEGIVGLDVKFSQENLSLLVIATWEVIFVFDVQLERRFLTELTPILTSKHVLKVLFDGAKIVKNIPNLANFVDIQVTDAALKLKENSSNGIIHRRSLSKCLEDHLGASREIADDSMDADWGERPVAQELRGTVGDRVLYLIALNDAVEKRWNNDLYEDMKIVGESIKRLEPGEAYYVMTKSNKQSHRLKRNETRILQNGENEEEKE